MLKALKTFDENLFLLLNAQHNSFFDQVMWLFSDRFFWIPLYLWFLWILYKKFPRKYWTVLIAITLMIIASDQLCNFFKESVMRLRPTYEPHIQSLVHTVNEYTGGTYGFYSSHASNAFAVALFMIITFGRERKYLIPITLLYASMVAYSRVYLGVHYPGDIVTGAFFGAIIGIIFAFVHQRIRTKYIRNASRVKGKKKQMNKRKR